MEKGIDILGNFCFASGIGKARVVKYTQTLKQLALWLKKDFCNVNKGDIEKLVISIQHKGKT